MAKKRVNKKNMNANVKCNIYGRRSGCGGCAYFLGFLGAAVYYLQTTTGFWNGVVGILKALVWPAFLVFELLKFIGA